jgi:hypothetical protein
VFATGEVEMAADPETVWAVMADISRWPDWNADISAATLHGPVRPGTSLSWKSGARHDPVHLPGSRAADQAVLDRQDHIVRAGSAVRLSQRLARVAVELVRGV